MTEPEQKILFAKLFLKMDDPFKAALQIFPDNTPKALEVSHMWPREPEVIAIKNGILDGIDEMELLPTKAEFCRDLIGKLKTVEFVDDYTKLATLYANVRGFIEKPGTSVNIQNNQMAVVPDTSQVESVEDAERLYKEMLEA